MTASRPHPTDGAKPRVPVHHAQPRDGTAVAVVVLTVAVSLLGLWLALQASWWLWAGGQLVLALALLRWFVLLHEAGHGTLFRRRTLNHLTGHLAGALAMIPFASWRRVHALHHRHTGWQDLDPTTALLVPRPLSSLEHRAINVAWRLYLPLFSITYRVQNFWNLPRLKRYLSEPAARIGVSRNIALLALFYFLLAFIGGQRLTWVVGPALLFCLVCQDLIILGQHTHMPAGHAEGRRVASYPAHEQGPFTRSVLLPRWLSWWLLGVDLHELHHQRPGIPGYHLHHWREPSPNGVHWLRWVRAAKRLSGVSFLFGRREHTGLSI